MKIALIGATGFVGSAILQEALQRGHEVTAIVRDELNVKDVTWGAPEGNVEKSGLSPSAAQRFFSVAT